MTVATAPDPRNLAGARNRRRTRLTVGERRAILSEAYLEYVLGQGPRPDTCP